MKKTELKILCTICARAGSKGIKNKNFKLINGKPLIEYTITQAFESHVFDKIILSTDSAKIKSIGSDLGLDVFFKRPPELSGDKIGKIDVIRHALVSAESYYGNRFDIVIDLDVTSPLREVCDICDSLQQFLEDDNCNLITATPARRSPYFNLVELDELGKVVLSKPLKTSIKCRQDSPKCYDMNASIYIWKRDFLIESNSLFNENTGLYVMPEERSFDIDSALDFDIVEMLMEKKNETS